MIKNIADVKSKDKKTKLVISDTAPLYPPLWGGPKRIWNLYSNLGADFDITYVGVDPGNSKQYVNRKLTDNIREVIQPLCESYYPFRKFELKIIKNLTFDIFTYLLMWLDKGFKDGLNKYEADVLIASHPWTSPCFNVKKGQVFIYDAHNCEYLLMRQILKGRWYNCLISFFVKMIEKKACQKADIVVATTESDKQSFVELYEIPEEKIFVLPNGTCINKLPTPEQKKAAKAKLKLDGRHIVIFIGAYYNPNIEAAEFIVNKVAKKLQDVDFAMVGTVSDYFRNKKVPENIRLIGRVEDQILYDWLTAADIGINPVFTGSGINIKMLDYFSFAMPVISTWVGARGIDGIDSKDFLVADKDAFADSLKNLLEDKEKRLTMGYNARILAETTYDWKKISLRFNYIIRKLVKSSLIENNLSSKHNFSVAKLDK